jgi:gliding motility-associated-like protein
MLEIATGCFDYIQFNIVVNPLPIPIFDEESYIYCLNATEKLPISVQAGFKSYVWNTGEEGANLNKIYIDTPGNYSVTVTNYYGCEASVSVVVLPSNIATIKEIKINDLNGNGNNSIEIIAEGEGEYEYSLNSNNYYTESNIYNDLKNGYHTVQVRDRNGCGTVSQEILVLDYPNFFTPNNDGFNDYWNIIGMDQFPDAEIYIFNRFGELLKQISPISKGWDGTNHKGTDLPSNDYWFTIDLKDRGQCRGHFTLKR